MTSLLVTSSLVTVHLSPVWFLAQCCLLTLAFSLRVTIPTSTLSWLSIPWHWPTKIYICLSLSLMLPFNIGLPKTPPGLVLDRCHEPCPSVIPNTDQPRPNWDYRVWTQCYPNTSPIETTESGPRWQTPPILAWVSMSSNGTIFGVIPKITGVSRVIAPFTVPFMTFTTHESQ